MELAWPQDVAAAVVALAGEGELAWLDDATGVPDLVSDGCGAVGRGMPRAGDGDGRVGLVCTAPLGVLEQPRGGPAVFRVGRRVVARDANGWRLWRRLAREMRRGPLMSPISPGWVGYVSFEMVRLLERLPATAADDLGLPLLRMALYDRGIVLDYRRQAATLVEAPGLRMALGLPGEPVNGLAERWNACAVVSEPALAAVSACRPPCADISRADYEAMVGRALEYIAAGDIYQVNLARRLRFDDAGDPRRAYRRLRRGNPAAYGALLCWEDGAVVSVSPELFLRTRGREVLTSPIKGTRPHTGDPARDAEHRAGLIASAKEQAELAMIVDLHRNDLGRVCEFGSVRVRCPRRIETHPTVFHAVADVAGRLRSGCDSLDLLRACFPAGSVTGVPKIRAIEIIDELEPVARGAYTGAVGVLGLDGRMVLNVAIRTLQFRGQTATLYGGGGIVADSDPGREYEETADKLRGIVRAMTGQAAGEAGVVVPPATEIAGGHRA